jgi:uncharacterized protein YcfJ
MKTLARPLGAALALAMLVLARPVAAQRDRYQDDRYDDRYDRRDSERYDSERYDDERYGRAHYEDERYDDADDGGPEFDYARVIAADPIIDIESRPVQREECRQEPLARRAPPRTAAPAGKPGIIASVLAQPSSAPGASRTAAVAGASVRAAYTRRCTTRTEYVEEQRITGYDVTYRYRGRNYYAVTERDPGERIRVAVN